MSESFDDPVIFTFDSEEEEFKEGLSIQAQPDIQAEIDFQNASERLRLIQERREREEVLSRQRGKRSARRLKMDRSKAIKKIMVKGKERVGIRSILRKNMPIRVRPPRPQTFTNLTTPTISQSRVNEIIEIMNDEPPIEEQREMNRDMIEIEERFDDDNNALFSRVLRVGDSNDIFERINIVLGEGRVLGNDDGLLTFSNNANVLFRVRVNAVGTESFRILTRRSGTMNRREVNSLNIMSYQTAFYLNSIEGVNDNAGSFNNVKINMWNPRKMIARGKKKIKLSGKAGFRKFGLGLDHKYDQKYPCLFNCYFVILQKGTLTIDSLWRKCIPSIKEICRKGFLQPFLDYIKMYHQIDLPVYYTDFEYLQDNTPTYDKILVINTSHAGIVSRLKVEKKIAKSKVRLEKTYKIFPHKVSKVTVIYEEYYLDVETYSDKGFQIPYLICLYGPKGYIDFWGENCMEEFKQVLMIMKAGKSKKVIWTFNGGRFDYILLISAIIDKDTKIIGSATSYKQIECGNISFNDLYMLLPIGSLAKQCEIWDVPISKLNFDIAGKDREYFETFKEDIINYCRVDTLAVCHILFKFRQLMESEYKQIDFSPKKWMTLATLTFNIFKLYLDDEIEGSKGVAYENERDSYYGGVCYHTTKLQDKAYYYDINSSYPAAMLKEMPFKYLATEIYCGQEILETNLYLCLFEYNQDVNCVMTPQHTKNGLEYKRKIESSWRWGVELIFLMNNEKIHGLRIEKFQIYSIKKVFNKYITDIYNKRLESPTPQHKLLYKLLMNSLYGKFGQRKYKSRVIYDSKDLALFLDSLDTESFVEAITLIYKDGEIELYMVSVEEGYQDTNFVGSMVRFSSYITSLSRINLFEVIYAVGDTNIFYMDTDCVFSRIPIPQHYIDNNVLGKWKLEAECKDCYFWGPKLYAYKTIEGDQQLKLKGVSNRMDFDIERFERDKSYIVSDNTSFFRFFGQILVENRNKIIKHMDSRREWDDNISRPRD
jgi:hypothetical protein